MWPKSGLFCDVARMQQRSWSCWLRLPAAPVKETPRPAGPGALPVSGAQPRPGRVRRISLGRDCQQVAAPDVDAHQPRAVIATWILEEHDHTPVRCPGRPLG